jgi:hypothetical protein
VNDQVENQHSDKYAKRANLYCDRNERGGGSKGVNIVMILTSFGNGSATEQQCAAECGFHLAIILLTSTAHSAQGPPSSQRPISFTHN